MKSGVGKFGKGLDIRADGGYVIAPPSIHRSGRHYRWTVTGRPDSTQLADLPAWLHALVSDARHQKTSHVEPRAIDPVFPEGERNDALTRIAGAMRRRGCSEEAMLAALLVENARHCRPPLEEAEVARITRSIASYSPAPDFRAHPPKKTRGFTPFSLRKGRAEVRQ